MERDITAGRTILVGLFDDHDGLVNAVEELRAYGFQEDQIGFAFHDRGRVFNGFSANEEESRRVQGMAAGAATGGVVGGLVAVAALAIPGVGPIVAAGTMATLLGGTVLGATAGGLLGALSNTGLVDEDARYYDEEFRAGRNLLTVRADGRYETARDIMTRFGARDLRVTNSGARTAGTEVEEDGPYEGGPGRYAGGVTDEEEDPIRLSDERP